MKINRNELQNLRNRYESFGLDAQTVDSILEQLFDNGAYTLVD